MFAMVDNLLSTHIRESIMPISAISHQSKVAYTSDQTRSQKIADIKIDDPRYSSREGISGAQAIALDFVEFSSTASSTSYLT
jgi:hypothetical protein